MKKTINKDDSQKKILDRISRIEGQVRGIRKMIENEKECIDVITQITAIREAVSKLGIELLKDDFICKWGDKSKIDEAYLKTLFKVK